MSFAKSSACTPHSKPSVWQMWQRVRISKPLTQCITNYVSMEIMAATLLAAGASPAMVHGLDEVEDFASISSALLINMGTMSSEWVASKKLAAKQAVLLNKPWVLDPVGCGATPYRTKACLDMLHCKPTVVRGNASEIIALSGAQGNVKGVDSTAQSSDALVHATQLAKDFTCVVAVSGAVDYVTNGRDVLEVRNGVEMLTLVTAAGCSLTALVAAFVSQSREDPLLATAAAMAIFGIASERALETAAVPGPGSLRVGLLDQLFLLDEETVTKRIKIQEREVAK
ncbi:hypothetical protein CEUSTIGMA_g2516.t1 [Chlamydomonas eustigma]|uniref:hydroxyethylthiazole kinase n=1 Tax=Chlamydomonas eustigma TaxID=1157962 RepID=A0A250WWT1_9CHLO|nr:hypothetical protein CEUSTIGMA_g2516.t1 [Chlamydomonas eustigma]|eukprot:GAX75072.1 hypothetical protein CEUSTIGMA_g2516.t1 [Chlamydomonas eustigma]